MQEDWKKGTDKTGYWNDYFEWVLKPTIMTMVDLERMAILRELVAELFKK